MQRASPRCEGTCDPAHSGYIHSTLSCDILIVGGGPAGSLTALALAADHGPLAERTLLVEAAAHPRPKPCGGVIAGRALGLVERLAGPLTDVASLPVRRVLVRHGARVREHRLPRAALAVERQGFDAALMAAVRQRGVAVREQTLLVGLQRQPGGWRALLRGPDGPCEVSPRVVVGADGALGRVRRWSGLPRGRSRAWLAHTLRPAQDGDPPGDTLLFELPTDGPLAGYYWSFPAPGPGERPRRSHGLFHHGGRPSCSLPALLARRLGPGAAPGSAVQRLYQPGLPCAGPGVGLVGEALGADPLSGEGLAQAVLSGAGAATLLPELLAEPGRCPPQWSGRVLGPEARVLGQNAFFALAAYGPSQRWVTRRVMESPVLADVALRRFSGLRHSHAERWELLRRVVSDGGLW